MKRLVSPSFIVAIVALVFAAGGTAWATGALNGHNLTNNSITHNKIASNAIWHANLGSKVVQCGNLTAQIQNALAPCGGTLKAGSPGSQGPTGPAGATGATGANGFNGAFYSVEQYPNGAGSGAVATVACDPNDATRSQTFAAISGGVQDTDNSTDMSTLSSVLPIAASFPGRMDFSTFTPRPNRLDGWIVQFASGSGQDKPLEVWALCIPVANDGGSIPVVTNSAG